MDPRHPTFINANSDFSYNRYLAIAARTVRRSLKEEARLASERRGQMDLRFAKWEVSELLQLHFGPNYS
jgi:hypothetical protein